MATAKKEEAGRFDLKIIDKETMELMADEFRDEGGFQYTRVSAPAGGGIGFTVPGEDGDDEVVKELVGVIVHAFPSSAYWAASYGEGDTMPDCQSPDGETGIDSHTGQRVACATCPHNMFGTKGRGKECSNVYNLYLLREGQPIPLNVKVSASSIAEFRAYRKRLVAFHHCRLRDVVTRISAKAEKQGTVTYSKLVFALGQPLEEDQRIQTAEAAALFEKERSAAVEALLSRPPLVAAATRPAIEARPEAAAMDPNDPLAGSGFTPTGDGDGDGDWAPFT